MAIVAAVLAADGVFGVGELAGTIAGSWLAAPGTKHGHELIAAGLLIVSGPVDRDVLKQWVRTGYERGQSTWRGYGPSS